MTATRVWLLSGVAAAAVLVAIALSAGAIVPVSAFNDPHSGPSGNPQYRWNATNSTVYPVTFNESGLPTGTFWSVDLQRPWNGGYGTSQGVAQISAGWGWPGWNGTNGTSVGFELRNGTYQFSIGNARDSGSIYVASPSSGSVTVNGSGAAVSVTFTALVLNSVTFVESGLPSGTNWSVGLHSAPSWGGGWGYWGHSHGTPIFAWNGSSNSTIGFALPNGTYDFYVGPVWTASGLYLPSPSDGNVTVNGTAVSVSVSFTEISLYDVTFNETGLPNGTLWSAAVFNWSDGVFVRGASNSTSVTIAVANGTYDFGVGAAWNGSALFVPDPNFGNVTVAGSTVTVSVQFSVATYSWWAPSDPR